VWDFVLPVILLGLYAQIRRARGRELPGAVPIRPLVAAQRRGLAGGLRADQFRE